MKTELLRKPTIQTSLNSIKSKKRDLQRITNSIPEWRMKQIDNYLRNAERGCLPTSHDGADVTRQITPEQISKFQKCPDCQHKPVVFIPFKKDCVGVCAKHWIVLSETVIGWNEKT